MVKLVNPKPNILDRIKSRNRFLSNGRNQQPKEMPKDKGDFRGSCNRSACLAPGATWYNHSTRRYYCSCCAYDLNEDSFNKRDAMQMYGHNLCTHGEFDPNLDYRNDKPIENQS